MTWATRCIGRGDSFPSYSQHHRLHTHTHTHTHSSTSSSLFPYPQYRPQSYTATTMSPSSSPESHSRSPHTLQIQSSSPTEIQSGSPHTQQSLLFSPDSKASSPHITPSNAGSTSLLVSPSSSSIQTEQLQQQQQEQLQGQREQIDNYYAAPPPSHRDTQPQLHPVFVSVSDHFTNDSVHQYNHQVTTGNGRAQRVTSVDATPAAYVSMGNNYKNNRQCCSKRAKIMIAVLMITLAIFLAVMFGTVWKPSNGGGNISTNGGNPSGPCNPMGCLNSKISCDNSCIANDATYKSCAAGCNGDSLCKFGCQTSACFGSCTNNILSCLKQCGS